MASATLLLIACRPASLSAVPAASRVAVFDGHSDFAIHYARARPPWSLSAHDMSSKLPGQSDIPRWRVGGIEGALVTVSSDVEGNGTHFPRLVASLDWFDALVARHSADLAHVRTVAELRSARRQGRIALMPAIEGGDQIDGSIGNLRRAFERGVRSMLIVYDHHNDLGDGAMVLEQSAVLAKTPSGGLTDFGRAVIGEMNRLGMIVDLSHASDSTARQGIAASSAPVIFSHSGARAIADTARNVSDETLRLVAANGGLVMVPLAPYLVTTKHWEWWSAGEAHYAALVKANPDGEAAVEQAMAAWDRANPEPPVTVADVADQVEHIASVAGHDHVGIGTDFDGMGRFRIAGLADAAQLPALFSELRRRGWTESQLKALGRGNFERLLREVEARASR
jgi:membrane dipeptidase